MTDVIDVTEAAQRPADPAEPAPNPRRAKVMFTIGGPLVAIGATAGLALSWDNLVKFVTPAVGDNVAPLFPAAVDILIIGTALMFLGTCAAGRPMALWRWLSLWFSLSTLVLNAASASDSISLLIHVAGPAAWVLVTETAAVQFRGDYRRAHRNEVPDSIPLRLWIFSPWQSAAVWLQIARRLSGEQMAARQEVGRHAAAIETLQEVIPGLDGKRARSVILRQLRSRSLTPADVLAACEAVPELDAAGAQVGTRPPTPAEVLRAALALAAVDVQPAAPARPGRPSRPSRARVSQVSADVPTPGETSDNRVGQPPAETSAETAPSRPQVPRREARAPRPEPTPDPAPEAPTPAPEAPALAPAGGKRGLAAAALAETGGDATAAVRLLAERGTPVGKSTVFDVARTFRTGSIPVITGADSTPVQDSIPARTSVQSTPVQDSIPAAPESGSTPVQDSIPDSGPDSIPAAGLDSNRAPERAGAGVGPDSDRIPESSDLDFSDRTVGSDTGSDGARRRSGAGSDTGSDTRRRRSGTAVASAPEPAADAPEGSDLIDLTDQSPRLVAVR